MGKIEFTKHVLQINRYSLVTLQKSLRFLGFILIN